jgi:hypothetical protein
MSFGSSRLRAPQSVPHAAVLRYVQKPQSCSAIGATYQLRGALFRRAVLSRPKVSPAVTQLNPDAEAIFKDSYLVIF